MQVGDLLDQKYRLYKKCQSVWLAEDVRIQTICLLKPLSDYIDPDVVDWLSAVWYPGIPRVQEKLTAADGETWVIMEYMQGKPLHKLRMAKHENELHKNILQWMRHCSRLLTFLHNQGNQPLAHLDIKPEHLLLTDSGQINLIDFGAARIFREKPQCSAGHLYDKTPTENLAPGIILTCAGNENQAMTPLFAAPEQLYGNPCPASDVYSLGLSMTCLLTGKSPSAARNSKLDQLLFDQPAEIQRVFEQCLQLSPASRYASAELLTADLEQVLLNFENPAPNIGLSEISITSVFPFDASEPIDQSETGCADKKAISDPTADSLSAPAMLNEKDSCMISIDDRQIAAEKIENRNELTGIKSERLNGQIICIWDGAEFGCELAAMMAESGSVLLIESDWFSPKSDLLLGISGKKNWLAPRQPLLGLDQVLVAQQQERLDASELDRLCETGKLAGLRTLRPHRDLHHYEYYPSDVFYHVIMLAKTLYRNVILLCNQFIYDAYTCIGLMTADQIIIPLTANIAAFREYGRSIAYLQDKSILRKDNIHFVAFSYSSSQDLSWGSMNALSGDRMLGCISEQKQRRIMRSGKKPYAAAIAKQNRNEYQALIRQLSHC